MGKVMGQVHECWWRICQEVNVFSRFEYYMFYVTYPFVTYLLTLPCTNHLNILDGDKSVTDKFENWKLPQGTS
jgi:hypothetical protein